MRVPISWLKEFVNIILGPDELAQLMTSAGMEVGKVERVGMEGAELVWDRERVVLGQVLKVEPHPDADKLVLATVEHGRGKPKVVVTGAPNLFPFLRRGDLAEQRIFSPFILEGATYLDPYKGGTPTTLKGKKLRGIYNDSMLCSAAELGIGEDHEGIILMHGDEDSPPYRAGTPLQDLLGDAILDVDIIPNIARCASIIGIAREVAALTGERLQLPDFTVIMNGEPVAERVRISTESPELNPRFVALVIEGVEQKESPFWMQHRLRLAGQRPINVVVDISNYVMLETGQPNHTFDFDFLRRRADGYDPDGPIHIITRLAMPGEKLVTLDGTEHELYPNNILVTDPQGNLSLGGIMGGLDSEIQPHTTNVLLEAAAWNFINIRQSSRQLGLQTEAGFRFSRGVHPSQALLGAQRAAELLRRLAGGTVAQGIIDSYPHPAEPVTVALKTDSVRRLSGLDPDPDEIASLLERLEFQVARRGDRLDVIVPDHRMDIEGPHDLVEEVCRMYGYDRIPSTVLADPLPPQRGNPKLELEEHIKDVLVELGLQEVITYRLTTPEAEARALVGAGDDRPYLKLANPSTSDRVALRHSLLASVLEVVAANSRFQDRIALFEIGSVFLSEDGQELPSEPMRLAVVMTGVREAAHWENGASPMLDFFDLKGVVESLVAELKIDLRYEPIESSGFRPGRTAQLVLAESDHEVGMMGELHPLVVERYDLRVEPDQPLVAAVLDLDGLLSHVPQRFRVEALPVHPPIREDLALVVDETVPAAAVEQAMLKAGGPLLQRVELFDVFTGEKLGAGKKSLAYHLTFQSPSKTLKDKEAGKLRSRILKELEQKLGATLRD